MTDKYHTDEILIYPKGKVLLFSTGEYSDWSIRGLVVTIQECNLPKLVQEYLAEKEKEIPEEERDWDFATPENFPSWLIAKNLVLPIEHADVHLGSYSSFEKEFLAQGAKTQGAKAE